MEFAYIFIQPFTHLYTPDRNAILYIFQVYVQITASVDGSIRMCLELLQKCSFFFYSSKIPNIISCVYSNKNFCCVKQINWELLTNAIM